LALWDVGTGKEALVLAGHQGGAMELAFSQDGRTLIAAGGKRLGIWHSK
jgi:WD40 repeat protein